jgi:hypothetical protein
LAGIHAEIARARYEFWSSLAPLPVEAVLEAGKKAKEQMGKLNLQSLIVVLYVACYFLL